MADITYLGIDYAAAQTQAELARYRSTEEIYRRFKIFQDSVLKNPIINDSTGSEPTNRGCKWRSGMARVNNSRFFILDTLDRKDIEANWTVARDFCDSLNELDNGSPTGKWRLARIEHLTTFRLLALEFEDSLRDNRFIGGTGFKDSWYWIDAYFNYTSKMYVNSDWEPLKFNSVLLYRNLRPLGIGAHLVFDVPVFNFDVPRRQNYQQCLTFSLPWPNEAEKARYPNRTFGFQASFDARACEASQKFKPICESLDPKCRFNEDRRNFNYFALEGYAQKSYVDDGVWVFANRRFLVNLKPRNKTEAENFCKSIKTQLYTPIRDDVCLIPYVKLWNIRQTHLHFWTSIRSNYTGRAGTSRMFYANNTQFELHNTNYIGTTTFNITDNARIGWHEGEENQDPTLQNQYSNLCVTANWGYEYPNETAYKDNPRWNFLAFAYANCNLYMGTICEPLNVNFKQQRKCNWKRGWTSDYDMALNATAVIEFGYTGTGIYRSTYKQQFGQHICQTQQKMAEGIDFEISPDTLNYHNITEKELKTKVEHYYDYLEPYWVVDSTVDEEDWFKYATKDEVKCKISQAVKIETTSDDQIAFRREVKVVNCLEWHFYLCGPDVFQEFVK
ncbi:unnamed protein product [Orchesella dallaii]|uniref:Uncharacterized protein n=1 Tax=Orchesella dallaii TaxID=48710 RepID=A0ABP1QMB1_9HEXA